MAGNARLRLAENGDQFADCQFGAAEQSDEPQPGDFADGIKAGKELVEGGEHFGHGITRHDLHI